jgi:general secretion pathway protein M
MTENLTLWWLDRSPRERTLLGIMFGLAGLLLLWLLVVRPLADQLDAAKARHNAAVIALAEARARGHNHAAEAPTPAPTLPVDGLIARTANEAGFTGARIVGQGPNRANVTIAAARPQALFAWVARLEASGLIVERLHAQANADHTLSVEAALAARGR